MTEDTAPPATVRRPAPPAAAGLAARPVANRRARPAAGRTRRLAPPLLTLAAVLGAFGYVGAVDPHEAGHYPVCPLLHWTGLFCPGCGGLRSAHAVAHGDLAAAFGANALAVAAYAVFAVIWTVWLVRAVRRRAAPSAAFRPVHWWTLSALVAAFTLVRNLPFGSALAP